MNYYGYDPAAYVPDYSFIGAAIDKFGQAAIEIGSTMSARKLADQTWLEGRKIAVQKAAEAGVTDPQKVIEKYNSTYIPRSAKEEPETAIKRWAQAETVFAKWLEDQKAQGEYKQGQTMASKAIATGGPATYSPEAGPSIQSPAPAQQSAQPIGGWQNQPMSMPTSFMAGTPTAASTLNQAQGKFTEMATAGNVPQGTYKAGQEYLKGSGLQEDLTAYQMAQEERLSKKAESSASTKDVDNYIKLQKLANEKRRIDLQERAVKVREKTATAVDISRAADDVRDIQVDINRVNAMLQKKDGEEDEIMGGWKVKPLSEDQVADLQIQLEYLKKMKSQAQTISEVKIGLPPRPEQQQGVAPTPAKPVVPSVQPTQPTRKYTLKAIDGVPVK